MPALLIIGAHPDRLGLSAERLISAKEKRKFTQMHSSLLNWRVMLPILVLAVIATMVGIWFVLFPTPVFPVPSGPHGIGTRLYRWTDTSRPEPFTADPNDHRTLAIQVWYPTAAHGVVQPYIEQPPVIATIGARLHVPAVLLGRLQSAPTHAMRDVPPETGLYPVLINPTGFSGFHAASLFWIEELVSQGYVVVTVDQPGTAAAAALADGSVLETVDKAMFDRYMPLALSYSPDQAPVMNGVSLPGGIVPYLSADMSFVLDQLAVAGTIDIGLSATLDLDRVGIFGMSLGGYIGPEACRTDSRFRACLAVDAGKTAATADAGLAQPLMIISRDAEVMREERSKAGGWPEQEIEHTIRSQRRLFETNAGDAYFVTMNGMYHVNWTDAPIWSPLISWLGLGGPINPYDGFSTTNTCTLSFFDHYLRGRSSAAACAESNQNITRVEFRTARPIWGSLPTGCCGVVCRPSTLE